MEDRYVILCVWRGRGQNQRPPLNWPNGIAFLAPGMNASTLISDAAIYTREEAEVELSHNMNDVWSYHIIHADADIEEEIALARITDKIR